MLWPPLPPQSPQAMALKWSAGALPPHGLAVGCCGVVRHEIGGAGRTPMRLTACLPATRAASFPRATVRDRAGATVSETVDRGPVAIARRDPFVRVRIASRSIRSPRHAACEVAGAGVGYTRVRRAVAGWPGLVCYIGLSPGWEVARLGRTRVAVGRERRWGSAGDRVGGDDRAVALGAGGGSGCRGGSAVAVQGD